MNFPIASRLWRHITGAVSNTQLPTLRLSPAEKQVRKRRVEVVPMTLCIIVRPGQTEYERQGRIAGALDLPLNDEGERQVDEIVSSVRKYAPKSVICGSHDPANSTGRAIGQALGIPVRETDSLGNVDMGLWQGLLVSDIRQKHPKLFKKWQETPVGVTAPEGEDCGSAAERVESALKKPLRKGEPFVVVAAEPLATLIASFVRGESPKLCGPGETASRPLVEAIARPAGGRISEPAEGI